ncbi:MAG: PilN domain-containing protein [Thiobacillaceae bacterium]|jgi:type IV pilus assembly protein PilN|nr:PilN domain-containing protein [Thiobacillaceae bacterium]
MTPIRINLLPHRQQKRAQQQRLMVLMTAAVAAAGALVVFAGHMVIADSKAAQMRRNDLLRQQTVVLDAQIQEIKQLKDKTKALLDRKIVVESLQTNRAEAVHLFDEIARRVPEGLYLRSLKQAAEVMTLQGYAQSSARVSTFMRSLDESPWFEGANLVEVRSAQVDKLRVSEFTLTVKQTKQAEGG